MMNVSHNSTPSAQTPMPATTPQTDANASGGSFTKMKDPYRNARPDAAPSRIAAKAGQQGR